MPYGSDNYQSVHKEDIYKQVIIPSRYIKKDICTGISMKVKEEGEGNKGMGVGFFCD